ncbi:acyltransferase family protein [Streptomyces sp. NPDC059070]|uniref:acyltransferase family protein n=1 Tax=unclassified Streptomyces TaxID=2593676 RepID=UPI0034E2ABE3
MSQDITDATRPASSEHSSRLSLSRLPSLTGMRFAAAFLVFCSHIGSPLPQLRLLKDNHTAAQFTKYTENAGALGVTFFFVLSGFVLTWSAREQDTARAFWRRRFAKIYPNYVIAWALALILFASSYTPTRVALANLFMVQVWKPDYAYMYSVDPPSWSLGVELVFYASFPLLHRWFVRIRDEHLKYWIAGVTAAILLTPMFTYAVLPDPAKLPASAQSWAPQGTSITQIWFALFLPPVRVLDFALGMLLAHAVMRGRWRNIGMIWSSFLLAGSYWLAQESNMLVAKRAAMIIPIALLIAAAATRDVEGKFTVFSNRAMIWLGEVSFAFYLLHFIVLQYGRKLLGHGLYSTWQTVGLNLMLLAVSVLAAAALYLLVERPITRRWSAPRRVRPAPA